MKKFFQEFKEFISRGNIIDMAVGVVIGGAFGKIVSSLVADIITPLIALATGGVSFVEKFILLNTPAELEGLPVPLTATAAKEAGYGILTYGAFIQAIIDFLIISFCIFLFLKGFMALQNKLKEAEEKLKKEEEEEKKAEEAPAEPVETTDDILKEIRDLLKEQK